jgi:hypothetical protein
MVGIVLVCCGSLLVVGMDGFYVCSRIAAEC